MPSLKFQDYWFPCEPFALKFRDLNTSICIIWMTGVVSPWWPNKVWFVGPWVIYWISKWMLYNIVFVPAIQRHDYSLHIKNDIQVYNRSRSKLIGAIRCIVPPLTDGNQNQFYWMLVCLVKRQTAIFSPSAGPLPLTFTCAGERAGPRTRCHPPRLGSNTFYQIQIQIQIHFFWSFQYKYKYTGKNLIKYKYKYSSSNTNTNTKWGRDKIAAILQLTYWNCIVRRLFIHSNYSENCFQMSSLQ